MTIALALPLLELSDDERRQIGILRGRITTHAKKNAIKIAYYEGKHRARSLDIAVPPSLANLEVQVDHPATITDILAERILWDGWTSTGSLLGLDDIYRENELGIEQSQATIDALICGVAFVSVGSGDTGIGEPTVLLTAESPSSATIEYSQRLRRAVAGLSQTRNEFGSVTMETLYLPNETIRFERIAKRLVIVDRDRHNMNRVSMVRLTNQERATDRGGRSEITPAIRYYTDATARTLLGMEINREFYTAPQRYGLGVDPEQFGLDENSSTTESVRKGWEISMARMNFIPRDDDGNLPEIGQFPQGSPAPYIEMTKHYAQLLAAAAAIPSTYLGFATENPPSADAIRALESRLIKRAELRQRMFGRAWMEAGRLSLMHRDPGAFDADAFAKISIDWLSASTATPAADADRVGKLIAADVVPAHSEVAGTIAGLSKSEVAQIEVDRRLTTIDRLASGLKLAAEQARSDPQVAALTIRDADAERE